MHEKVEEDSARVKQLERAACQIVAVSERSV